MNKPEVTLKKKKKQTKKNKKTKKNHEEKTYLNFSCRKSLPRFVKVITDEYAVKKRELVKNQNFFENISCAYIILS